MKIEYLVQLADQERAGLAEKLDPRLKPLLREFFIRVTAALPEGSVEIMNPRDLFLLCENLDKLDIPPELVQIFQETRAALGDQVLEALYEENRVDLKIGDIERSRELVRQRDLSRMAAELLKLVKGKKPDSFGPTWIQLNGNGLYTRLMKSVRDPQSGVNRWDLVKNMLPPPWQERFTVEKTPTADQQLVAQIKQYEDIARNLGPEALAEFLISLNPEGAPDFSTVVKIISQYLGRHQAPPPGPPLPKVPPAALLLPGFRKTLFVQLRNRIYKELLRAGKDDSSDAEQYRIRLEEVERIAKKFLDEATPAHREFYEELMIYFRSVLSIKTPPNMVTNIRNAKTGRVGPFPSLRQRMAMKEIERDPGKNKNGRLLVSFFMGMGKTGTAFLAKEHVGAKKLLYICPNPDLVKQTASRVGKYYKDGQAPSVGTILSENKHDIANALQKDIVILPFTMFSSEVEGTALVDLVKAQGFDFVVVDEVHNARNEEHRDTETVFQFVSEIPGLYEKGHVMLLSGDPIPNGPDDIVPQLRIYDHDIYADAKSLRALVKKRDPLLVRNALLDFLLLIDEPEDWKQYVQYVEFALTEDELRVYTAILEDEDLTATQKLERLSLALLNPDLFSESTQESSYVDTVVELIIKDFERYDVVMVGENLFKGGVLRAHSEHPGIPSLVEKVEKKLRECNIPGLEIHVYDGDTPTDVRKYIIDRSKESAAKKNRKMVVFANTETSGIREGTDLSHIQRVVVLEPNYNNPDLAQFVKRFAREGEEDVKVRVLVPHDTVFEGIRRHANKKEILCDRLKHSGTLTEDDLAFLESDKLDEKIQIDGGIVIFGTDISDKLHTDRKRLAAMFSHLYGRGGEEYERFIQTWGDKFAELYAEYWEKAFSGNNNRFISGLVEDLVQKGMIPNSPRIADVACGPLALTNTLGVRGKTTIESFDLNPYMIDQGFRILANRNPAATRPVTRVTRMDKLGVLDGSFDCVNLATALHYSKLNVQKKDPLKDERANVLFEQNRVLKEGGVFILTMPKTLCSEEEFKNLCGELANFGFEVLGEYTGSAQSVDDEEDPFENYTLVAKKVGAPKIDAINLKNLRLTRVTHTSEGGRKKKRAQTELRGSIHNIFQINNEQVEFSAASDEALKTSDEEHERLVEDARKTIMEIYTANGMTLDKAKQTPEQQAALKAKGITLIKNRHKGSPTLYWTFTLGDRPDEAEPVFPA